MSLSKHYIETPFNIWLVFEIKELIERVYFSELPEGQPLQGELKNRMLKVFDTADLTFFDHSALNIDRSRKSYRLYMLLAGTKAGEVFTYAKAAEIVYGSKRYARAVASMLRANRFAFVIPCHRVISASGIGGFSANVRSPVDLKRRILSWEKTKASPIKGN